MGVPAELTDDERSYAHKLADQIVDRVTSDECIIEMLPGANAYDSMHLHRMVCRDELTYALLVMAQEIRLMRAERVEQAGCDNSGGDW